MILLHPPRLIGHAPQSTNHCKFDPRQPLTAISSHALLRSVFAHIVNLPVLPASKHGHVHAVEKHPAAGFLLVTMAEHCQAKACKQYNATI